jgi:hypothetical protein
MSSFPHLRTQRDPICETSCFIFSRIPDDGKVQKPSNPLCHAPSLESFRNLQTKSDFCISYITKSASGKCNLRNILLKLFIHLFGTRKPRKGKSMNALQTESVAVCPRYGRTNVIQFAIRLHCKLQKRGTILTTIPNQNRWLKLN